MADLRIAGTSDYTTTGTPDSATPITDSTNGSDGTDLVAANLNGLFLAVPELQTLLGNALTLKGTVADLATRLSRVISAGGALANGNAFPGTPIAGQPFWRTDQALFYVYDAGTGQWILGQDNPLYVLTDGTRDFVGTPRVKTATPGIRLKGTEVSGRDILIEENAGNLIFYDNTGTELEPVWTQRFSFNMATGAVTTTAGVTISSGGLNVTGNLDVSGTMNSGTVPVARIPDGTVTQAKLAKPSVGTPELKSSTGAASGNLNSGTSQVDITMNDYSFSPMISFDSTWLQLYGRFGGDTGTTQGSFAIFNSDGTVTNHPYVVRWRYMTASDNPDVWIVVDPSTGLVVSAWWSDDPIPGTAPPIVVKGGNAARRLTASDLQRLSVPANIVTQAQDFIRQNNLNPANLVQRALRIMTGEDAPAAWLFNNCKVDAQGHLAQLTAQEKAAAGRT